MNYNGYLRTYCPDKSRKTIKLSANAILCFNKVHSTSDKQETVSIPRIKARVFTRGVWDSRPLPDWSVGERVLIMRDGKCNIKKKVFINQIITVINQTLHCRHKRFLEKSSFSFAHFQEVSNWPMQRSTKTPMKSQRKLFGIRNLAEE